MKTLILGMGNPILSDDGVGLVMARRLENRIQGADVAESTMVGLSLLDQVLGYDRLFIIDAMTTYEGIPGEVKTISREDCFGSLHLFSSHGLNIFELMELGRSCGYEMPELSAVYGIEIGSEVAFGSELSDELEKKLDTIEETVLRDMTAREPVLATVCVSS